MRRQKLRSEAVNHNDLSEQQVKAVNKGSFVSGATQDSWDRTFQTLPVPPCSPNRNATQLGGGNVNLLIPLTTLVGKLSNASQSRPESL